MIVSFLVYEAMATATKRSVTNKTLKEKYEALKELEKGAFNKSVAEKYLVPKNTLSTWVKTNNKYLTTSKQEIQSAEKQEVEIMET